MKKVISIILACLMLFGCSSDIAQNKAMQTTNTATEENQMVHEDVNGTADADKTPNKVNAEYRKYADFLGIDEEVTSFIKEDIDLDGKQEIVLAFGVGFLDTFVLREDDTGLILVGKLEGHGYGTYEVELVHLQGLSQGYVLTKVTNGANLYGFALYKINNNELEQVAYSASATGSGDDYLVDVDKDGKFDGYVQDRSSYDVMYLPTVRIYKLIGEDFILESSHMELGEYPETPEEVVEQYLELSLLDEEKSSEFDSRFKELSVCDKSLALEKNESWNFDITIKHVSYTSERSKDHAKVTAANEAGDNIIFDLALKNKKWQITECLQTQIRQNTTAQEKELFVGAIGNSKVHAKLEISGDGVSGVYYYDQYKTYINLKGYADDSIKGMQTILLTEDTPQKGEIKAVYRTKDYMQGIWSNGKDVFPMYLIREGSNIAPPAQPGKAAAKFEGHWAGKSSEYFIGSEADIYALSDDLIYYALLAFNGTHNGALEGFGVVKDGIAQTTFEDKTYDEKENVVFGFRVDNDVLKLKSNMYDYMCGMGVGFDSDFQKWEMDILIPTAQQVGIVDTKEKDELFRKLVGDEYNSFIMHTQGVGYSEVLMDGEYVSAGPSILMGYNGNCYYVISKEHIYAAIINEVGKIDYYTNDKNHESKLPVPMAEWAESRGGNMEIEYNYKGETK